MVYLVILESRHREPSDNQEEGNYANLNILIINPGFIQGLCPLYLLSITFI